MKIIQIIILLLISNNFFAQEQKISNIRFEQAGQKVKIYYDLICHSDDQYFIQVYLSNDGGQHWGFPLKHVSGDVGENQTAGRSKVIVWDVLKDLDSLTGNIQFKVAAFYNKIGYFVDKRDGQQYKWVKIGNQVWMAENLNYETVKSWKYNDMHIRDDGYGRLYSWESAVISCPKGWHLPSDKEWSRLATFLGGDQIAGKKIKAVSGWEEAYFKGNNESGFSAVPAGYRKTDGVYEGKGNVTVWWTATQYQPEHAWSRSLGYSPDEVLRSYEDKRRGYSVRCIKD